MLIAPTSVVLQHVQQQPGVGQSLWSPARRRGAVTWAWLDGQTYASMKVNGADGEDCKYVVMDTADLTDYPCREMNSFICEGPLNPRSNAGNAVKFEFEGKLYWILPLKLSWHQSQGYCMRRNSTLAVSFRTSVPLFIDKIKEVLTSREKEANVYYWIGLHRKAWMELSVRTKGWELVPAWLWGAGEPSYRGENVVVYHNSTATWAAAASFEDRHHVLCTSSHDASVAGRKTRPKKDDSCGPTGVSIATLSILVIATIVASVVAIIKCIRN